MGNKKNQDYPFIKETIKQRPMDKRKVLEKLGVAAACGIVFGLSAVFIIMICMPGILDKYEQQIKKKEIVQITPSIQPSGDSSLQQETASVDKSTEEIDAANNEDIQEKSTVSHLQNIYKMVRKIAMEPQKALVRVAGITGDSDLLDDSLLTFGDEGGIVFIKNKDGFYIVTTSDRLEEIEKFRITFSNGKSAEGELCGADSRTNLVVIRVPIENIDEETQPVIAIGSPAGDMNALIYGSITSVSGKLNIADDEYALITTDMAGSQKGGGVLLDMNGRMTGIIISNDNQENTVLRAVSVAEIKCLLEKLSNGEPICYTGIRGTTISKRQSEQLNIPQGIFVDRVEQGSPAMNAGIQSGDILYKVGDQRVLTMDEYSMVLQNKQPGDRMEVTLYRKSPAEEYVDVELNILIKEK